MHGTTPSLKLLSRHGIMKHGSHCNYIFFFWGGGVFLFNRSQVFANVQIHRFTWFMCNDHILHNHACAHVWLSVLFSSTPFAILPCQRSVLWHRQAPVLHHFFYMILFLFHIMIFLSFLFYIMSAISHVLYLCQTLFFASVHNCSLTIPLHPINSHINDIVSLSYTMYCNT